MAKISAFTLILLTVVLSGCAHYVTPGARAELNKLAPESIEEGFSVQPTSPFPASIATIRLQDGNYSNYNLNQYGGAYGSGEFSVITHREIEEEVDFNKILQLPQVAGLVSLNRMLLPSRITGQEDLRIAASKLRADLLLVYTFDTKFFDQDKAVPLSVVTLGLSPTRKITATTTASALLIDTRTGFIYGAFESTAKEAKHSSSWGSRESSDLARLETEKLGFKQLIEEFVKAWPEIVASYANI